MATTSIDLPHPFDVNTLHYDNLFCTNHIGERKQFSKPDWLEVEFQLTVINRDFL